MIVERFFATLLTIGTRVLLLAIPGPAIGRSMRDVKKPMNEYQ